MTGMRLTGTRRTETREQAARLYVQGCTLHSVARQIGWSYGTTRTLILEAGVSLRRPGGDHGFRPAARP